MVTERETGKYKIIVKNHMRSGSDGWFMGIQNQTQWHQLKSWDAEMGVMRKWIACSARRTRRVWRVHGESTVNNTIRNWKR